MDFNKLLIPYNKGGTERDNVERTMGTIINYFLNKKCYPIDVVGASIFMIFMFLDAGGKFRGDGSYGSPGRELITSIRIKCDELLAIKLESITYQTFIEQFAAGLTYHIKPTLKHRFIRYMKYEFLSLWKGEKFLSVWE